jgi:maleate cis-trans isomerase
MLLMRPKPCNPAGCHHGRMYGHRARIGYTSPPRLTEVFCRDFYRVMPDGVSLVITTLAIREMSQAELEESLELARGVAGEMARAGVDVVVLGGVPINLTAAGPAGVEALMRETSQACNVPVTSSLSAQMKGLTALGASRLAVVQPTHCTFRVRTGLWWRTSKHSSRSLG